MDSKQLAGKVAIVAGGGSGIGRALAHGLAREGASVAVADIDRQRADAAAHEIAETGAAIGVAADVSDTKQVDAMLEEAIKQFGRLDIMINTRDAPSAASSARWMMKRGMA